MIVAYSKPKRVGTPRLQQLGNNYHGIMYAAIQSGWMERETFNNYFTRHFIRIIHLERPGMLIYDGHNYHFNVLLVEKEMKIL
jgi:hypothetical protein